MYTKFAQTLKDITHAGISELPSRGLALMNLIGDIVDYETDDGQITQAAGNTSLEGMDYWQTLQCILIDTHFERLGNGHFSAAYRHPLMPGKVFKVGFKKEDSGAAYVAFCRLHAGHEGIPVIHEVIRRNSCYIVLLDELVGLGSISIAPEDLDALEFAVDFAVSLVEKGRKHTFSDTYIAEFKECYKFDVEGLRESCLKIHEFFHGIARFDMHEGNMMVTKEGRLIITDPVSFTNDKVRKELDPIVDVESLLKEVENVAVLNMIERCKRRKESRDPRGMFQRMRKDRAEFRKEQRKRCREIVANRKAKRRIDMDWRKCKGLLEAHNKLDWCMPEVLFPVQAKPILRAHREAVIVGNIELPIDKLMQERFAG